MKDTSTEPDTDLNPSTYDLEQWLREDETAMISRQDIADKLEAMSVCGIVRGLIEHGLADEIRFFLDEHEDRVKIGTGSPVFEVGHFYKHESGKCIYVAGAMQTWAFGGLCLIGETKGGEFVSIDTRPEATTGWVETAPWSEFRPTSRSEPGRNSSNKLFGFEANAARLTGETAYGASADVLAEHNRIARGDGPAHWEELRDEA